MGRFGESIVEAFAEVAERSEGLLASCGGAIMLIGEIVGGAAEPVDVGKVRAEVAGHKEGEHREILVVRVCQCGGGDG